MPRSVAAATLTNILKILFRGGPLYFLMPAIVARGKNEGKYRTFRGRRRRARPYGEHACALLFGGGHRLWVTHFADAQSFLSHGNGFKDFQLLLMDIILPEGNLNGIDLAKLFWLWNYGYVGSCTLADSAVCARRCAWSGQHIRHCGRYILVCKCSQENRADRCRRVIYH